MPPNDTPLAAAAPASRIGDTGAHRATVFAISARAALAIVVFLVIACRSNKLTDPSGTSLQGQWQGTFTVSSCSVSGSYTECVPSLSPGITHPAVLLLTQKGATISGAAVYGS